MAIQMRRGNYGKFDPSKLLPGEYAVVQGDDPSARDGRSVYMAFAAGVVKRLATYEDMVENVSSALVDAIGDAAERLTERAEAINAAAEEGEAGRREAEAARAKAESARATAEDGRAKAEMVRVDADADRETRQAKNDADQAQNNAAAMGMTYHVCPSSEYELDQVDGLHNVPTVAGKPGTMYLTPRVDGATGEDRYDQWLLVDGSWELMGETGSHIEPVTTDDVDAITSGGSVTADRYLNATGLTYWWAKVRAALSSVFAAKSHTHAASAIASGTIAPARLPLATASAAGAVTVGDGLSVSGGMLSVDNAAYVKSGKACKLLFGSVVRVVPATADSVRVWTGSEFKSSFGKDFSATSDVVVFMNADATANDVHVEGSQYYRGDIYANVNKTRSADASVRLGYIVALAG